MSANAEKVILGKATKKDIERLNAIRAKLDLAFPISTIRERGDEMKELNERIIKLTKLKTTIEKKLNKKK